MTGKCPSNVPQDDPQGVAQDVAQGKNVSEDVGSSNRTSTGQVQPHKLTPQVHPTSTRQVTPQVKADKYRTSYDLFCNCFAGDCNEPFILINFGRETSGRVGGNYITYGDIKSISGSAPLLKKCRFERNFLLWTYFSYRRERERKSREKKRKSSFLTWEFWLDRCSVKTISCCLFGRKVEKKRNPKFGLQIPQILIMVGDGGLEPSTSAV